MKYFSRAFHSVLFQSYYRLSGPSGTVQSGRRTERGCSLITGSDAHRYKESYSFLSQRKPKFKLPLKHRTL
jgi:hypothetical protein